MARLEVSRTARDPVMVGPGPPHQKKPSKPCSPRHRRPGLPETTVPKDPVMAGPVPAIHAVPPARSTPTDKPALNQVMVGPDPTIHAAPPEQAVKAPATPATAVLGCRPITSTVPKDQVKAGPVPAIHAVPPARSKPTDKPAFNQVMAGPDPAIHAAPAEQAVKAITTPATAGLGCRAGTPAADILALLATAQSRTPHPIAALAIPAFKRHEPGLQQAATTLNLPLILIDDQALAAVQHRCPTRSRAAHAATGHASIAEAAALAATGGRLILPRIANATATCALAIPESPPE